MKTMNNYKFFFLVSRVAIVNPCTVNGTPLHVPVVQYSGSLQLISKSANTIQQPLPFSNLMVAEPTKSLELLTPVFLLPIPEVWQLYN